MFNNDALKGSGIYVQYAAFVLVLFNIYFSLYFLAVKRFLKEKFNFFCLSHSVGGVWWPSRLVRGGY